MLHNYDKITQVLNFFARKNSNSRIQKLKAIKLIWAADRYHMRKYGRFVSSDDYVAMKLGPVGSLTKRIAENDRIWLGEEILDETNKYVMPSKDGKIVISQNEVDDKVFSNSDREALEFAWDNFGQYDGFIIADISHDYPEWLRYADAIKLGMQKCTDIDPVDFFKDPTVLRLLKTDPFKLDDDILKDSEAVYTGAL
jgi:uncharacterized phage-associated protein